MARALPLVAAGMLAVASAAALAQPDAGSLLRQEEEAERSQPRDFERLPAEESLPPLTDTGDVTVEVESVEFTGDTQLVSEDVLNKAVEPAIGQSLDFEGLKALAARVTRVMKDEGWFLGRAYLPRQDVTDGVIRIQLEAGRLDSSGPVFEIRNVGEEPLRISEGRLQAMAARELEPGAPLRTRPLDRTVLLINDLPGISARASLTPGESPGSTTVQLNASQAPLLRGEVSATNFGNRSTGRAQTNFGLTMLDPTGNGDRLRTSFIHAEGLDLARGIYEFPLGYEGTRVRLQARYLSYEVVEGTEQVLAADLNGRTRAASVEVDHPLVRQRRSNLTLMADYEYSAPEDFSNGVERANKRIADYGVGLRGSALDRLFGGGRTTGSVRLGAGRTDLSRNADSLNTDQGSSGLDTHGRYATLRYRLSRLQQVHGPVSAYLGWDGQRTDRNLDSSQKFYPAGPNGVRAYPGGEASADEGDRLRVELRLDQTAPLGLGNLQYSAFYDKAWVRLNDDPGDLQITNATGRNRYDLSGFGAALTLSQQGRFHIGLTAARVIGNNPGRTSDGLNSDGRADEERVWLQGIWWL